MDSQGVELTLCYREHLPSLLEATLTEQHRTLPVTLDLELLILTPHLDSDSFACLVVVGEYHLTISGLLHLVGTHGCNG